MTKKGVIFFLVSIITIGCLSTLPRFPLSREWH